MSSPSEEPSEEHPLFDIDLQGNSLRVHLVAQGIVPLVDSKRYLDEFRRVIAETGCHEMVIDLKDVTVTDSSFLGVLVDICNSNVEVSLEHLTDEFREILKVTNIDRLVKVLGDERAGSAE